MTWPRIGLARKAAHKPPASPAKMAVKQGIDRPAGQPEIGSRSARGPAAPAVPRPHQPHDRQQPRVKIGNQQRGDGQAGPNALQPGPIVAPIVAERLVVLAPQRRRRPERSAGSGCPDWPPPEGPRTSRSRRRTCSSTSVNRNSRAWPASSPRSCGAQPAMNRTCGKPLPGQFDRFGRGVDADARIAIGQGGDVAARAAADVDDQRPRGDGGSTSADQPAENPPPADKPPVRAVRCRRGVGIVRIAWTSEVRAQRLMNVANP